MNVVHVVPSINADTGGPAVSVTELAAALARDGHRVSVFALDYDKLGAPRPAGDATVRLHPASFVARHQRGLSSAFRDTVVRETARGVDIVHSHGHWMWPHRYARIAAERSGTPLVISPRGMLDPWSRQRGRIKKFVAWRLYERANVRAAAAFHATSADEARSIRDCGITAPVAVIPNGVALPECPPSVAKALRHLVPVAADVPYVLFLSRLHPKKGLELLLEAWRVIQSDHPAVHLLIAGPDLIGYRATLERRAAELGVVGSVTFSGALDGDAKAAALANAEVFVLPSFSENFGIVVAEALAHGLPVITTKGTPWSSVSDEQCGWWIDAEVDPLVRALREALALSQADRCGMAQRGKALVRNRFSWQRAAADMARFYAWIGDDHCRPTLAPAFLAE